MPRKIDVYIEALHTVLPCTTRREIHDAMSRELRTRILPKSVVGHTISYVRRHADELGWTIPHASSAPGTSDGAEGRFFELPAGRTSEFGTLDGEQRSQIDSGGARSIALTERITKNLTSIMEMALTHENLRVHREYLKDTAEMLQTVTGRLTRLRNIMAEKQDRDAA